MEREIDGKLYYWIKSQTLLDTLPVLKIGGGVVLRRRLKNLVELNILEYKLIKKGGMYCYYRMGDEFYNLLYKKVTNSKEIKGTTNKYGGLNSKVKPKDNYIKNTLVKDNINSIAEEVINYLNKLVGTNYNYRSSSILNLIEKRINEGYEASDLKKVIKKKYYAWKDTEYEKYLRPSTLFNDNRFDEYLNQKDNKEAGAVNQACYEEFVFD
ncbi:conserved phage C-terminal domain-containing protein [Clostridium baratii]|uniref:conserved phage C-terminal domain-containing protein n=1 Tax=Clostridium baratii TaxID=1561 RepID=UPI0006C2259B|nr:conserved phage C-terminal domain-containing protein [Clostridium baratii]MDU4911157.1 conserved phage C-terminal domain-containing protein [Clostridium baratii]CUP08675.1 phage-related regulatory protein [Clostridium baratii]